MAALPVQRARSPHAAGLERSPSCSPDAINRVQQRRSCSPILPTHEGLDDIPFSIDSSMRGQPIRLTANTPISLEDSHHIDFRQPHDKPTAALQIELEELKSILERQHAEAIQLAAGGEFPPGPLQAIHSLTTDEQQRTALQMELVQKVLSVAPANKVRELCAMVACQQVEQEILIRSMKTNMDVLQQQVRALTSATSSTQEHRSSPSVPMRDTPLTSSFDVQKQLEEFDVKVDRKEEEMKSWFAEFCVCAIKETFGDEVQRQAHAITALNFQVGDLNEATKQSLESIKSLNLQVNELNQVTKHSLESLQQVLTDASMFDVPGKCAPLDPLRQGPPGDFPRKLDTIAEIPCENHEADANQIQTWFKTLYQDVVDKNSKELGQTVACESLISTNASDSRSATASDSSSDAHPGQPVDCQPSVDIAG